MRFINIDYNAKKQNEEELQIPSFLYFIIP